MALSAPSAPVLDAALDDGWALDHLDPKPVRLASVPPETTRRSMADVDDGWGLQDPIAFAPPPKIKRAKTQQELVDETVEAMEEALRLTRDEAAFFAAGDELACAPIVPVDDFSDLEPVGSVKLRRSPQRQQGVAAWWVSTARPLLSRRVAWAAAVARGVRERLSRFWTSALRLIRN